MSDPPLDTWRWAVVTANDRAGVLYIITFLGFTYSGLTFITRGFIKWRVFGLDDAAIVVAQVLEPLTNRNNTATLTVPDCEPGSIWPYPLFAVSWLGKDF